MVEEEASLQVASGPGLSKEDLRKLSRDVVDIKGTLGGASGQPTVHQMVLVLESHARGEKKALRGIQDSLSKLGASVASAESRTAEQVSAAVFAENNEKVMGLLREVKERLASELPALAGRLDGLKQAGRSPTSTDADAQDVPSASNGSSTVAADLQPVLDKLEEMHSHFRARQPGSKEEGQSEVKASVSCCFGTS